MPDIAARMAEDLLGFGDLTKKAHMNRNITVSASRLIASCADLAEFQEEL
jgi:hypothetical protein